jgi:hypothetical protein
MSVVESYLRSENIIHFRNAIRKHEIDNNHYKDCYLEAVALAKAKKIP